MTITVQITQPDFTGMTRFEFIGSEVISDLAWDMMRHRLAGHTRRMLIEAGQDPAKCEDLTHELIESVRYGLSDWNPAKSSNLLNWLFNRNRETIGGGGATADHEVNEGVEWALG